MFLPARLRLAHRLYRPSFSRFTLFCTDYYTVRAFPKLLMEFVLVLNNFICLQSEHSTFDLKIDSLFHI